MFKLTYIIQKGTFRGQNHKIKKKSGFEKVKVIIYPNIKRNV